MTQNVIPDFEKDFHPLFLPLDGQGDDEYKPEPIRAITVYRIERGNVRVTLGTFTPGELTSEEQIRVAYGGGTYEIVARRMSGHIYARRQLVFEGAPTGTVGTPIPQASPAPLPGSHAGDRDMQMMMMFVQLLKQSSDDTKQMLATMMQSQQQASQQNIQMMIAMMSAQTNAGASGQQAMATVLGRVLDAKSIAPQSDPAAQAAKMLELAKSLKSVSGDTTNWGEIIGGILAGLGAMAQQAQQQQQQGAAPTNGAPQPQVIDVPANGAVAHGVPQA